MSDVDDAKRALARLVATDVVARGERAVRDLERAAEFRESGGVARLRAAVAAADDPRAARGREALAAFERFRRAARGLPTHVTDADEQREGDAERRADERRADDAPGPDERDATVPPRSRYGFKRRRQSRWYDEGDSHR